MKTLMVPKPTIYLETSVVSYLTARPSKQVVLLAHQQVTREFWDSRLGLFAPFISEIVKVEAMDGDPQAAADRLKAIESMPILPVTSQVQQLAEGYLREGLLPGKAFRDALHLSLASIHGMDYIVTWNFRHLASPVVRRRVTEYNQSCTVFVPMICTPEELMGDEWREGNSS